MKKLILPVLAIAVLTGCKKDDPVDEDGTTSYTVPTTYNFENVSYGGQTDRLDMLTALTSYIKTGHTEGVTLDAQVMNNMYENENTPFEGTIGSSGKDLSSKTYETARGEIVNLFDSIAKYSGQAGGADGQAGLVARGTGHILVDATGKEYAQLIDKGLMGSCFYYQGTSKYLSDEKIGDAVDNVIVEPGKGTDKEHHFDEAFGYFGVPIDFPTNQDGLLFWGKYCNKRDAVVGTNDIMDAFLRGRAAISAKDKAGQDAAVADIKELWEKAAASTAIHYLNDADANFADDGNRLHYLSEAYAFINALTYNVDGSIGQSDVDEVLAALGDNYWTVTQADILAARDLLATKANLESVKGDL
ncbi:MAG: DUF4856 domain-containing protein [Flavobacteriales bacterium]|nr:DUF4856 domain-containing protein [Flavobacteriales bacterium]|tara:strand:+ start:2617 stop:3693 length:1077 start_codon:yes stop_codon:yes gene_type:complete